MVPLERRDKGGSNGVRIVIIRQVLNEVYRIENAKHKIYRVCREKNSTSWASIGFCSQKKPKTAHFSTVFRSKSLECTPKSIKNAYKFTLPSPSALFKSPSKNTPSIRSEKKKKKMLIIFHASFSQK
jgi:hypothetical protein